MYKITFTCETITPLFLAGADGQTPELRAPSIKGALRFWWRALNGHLATDEEGGIKNLLKEEEKLFGGVSDSSPIKSSVTLRIKFDQKKASFINIDSIKRNDRDGLNYLFYSLIELQKGRTGLDINNQFEIRLSSRSKEDLLKVCACFWVFGNLGSLGSRARRGAGAISIKRISGDIDIIKDSDLIFNLSSAENIADNFKQNMAAIKSIFNPNNLLGQSPEYSTLNRRKVFFSEKDFSTWEQALEDIGGLMRGVRKGKGAKKRKDRTFTMDTLDQKAAFGMPVGVQSGRGWIENSVEFVPKDYKRRSSPIWITIIKNAAGKYHWVVTHLQGKFMPPNASLHFTSNNPNLLYKEEGTTKEKREYPFPKENDRLLLKFIEQVKIKSNYIQS